ncbi:calcium-binding protein [Sphingobium sp. HBC34]|uniref:Calcium-binding protein n=1 Tax=Sphingobium cyanobacteriorum TaxID=3063954 RepID=A0ABT8ZM39_9SPHN|nr:calcium-binding protein [Sphingobium sp. HBC34]MDO7835044.1 calcium-binding protein [Sphingobium sp. HBC34]
MSRIVGSKFRDYLYGSAGDDRIISKGGRDHIYGQGGVDIIFAGDDDDWITITPLDGQLGSYIFGGAGFDRATLSFAGLTTPITIASNYIHAFTDLGGGVRGIVATLDSVESLTVSFGSANDEFHANDAGSTANGGAGDDRLFGGSGYDKLYGDEGSDLLDGGAGNDYISAGTGADSIRGGLGKDTIYGEDGDDLIYGQEGIDQINAGRGNDRVLGGDGDDNIQGLDGDDVLFGEGGRDDLYGYWGNDVLLGGLSSDYLFGHWGMDALHGGEANDWLDGGDDNDRLYGGLGSDELTGGAGHDRFVWQSLDEGGDHVVDFAHNQDLIVLTAEMVGGIAAVTASNFVSNANGVAKDADDHFLYSQSTHGLFFDPDGNGVMAKTLIAHIDFASGTSHIQASDIVIA